MLYGLVVELVDEIYAVFVTVASFKPAFAAVAIVDGDVYVFAVVDIVLDKI